VPARNLVLAALVVLLAGPAAALPSASVDAGWDGALRSTGLEPPTLSPTPVLLFASVEEGSARVKDDQEQPPSGNFDLFGDTEQKQAELADPELEHQIHKRRSMLKTHQILGLTTLGLMTATAVVGQINYGHMYGSNADGNDNFRVPHMVLSYTTAASFLTTAGFSVLAPEPVERETHGIDTVVLHKIAVIGASAGMLAQAGLGFSAARSADAGHPTRPGDLAAIHQVIGWTTLGFLATAATVWVF
jgi:hypothetical protein